MRVPMESGGSARTRLKGRPPLVLAGLVLVGLVVGALVLRRAAWAYTDFLWFSELGFTGVWTRMVVARLVLGASFTLLFLVVAWANLAIADMLSPLSPGEGPGAELAERYQEVVGSRAGVVRLAVAGVFALAVGPPAAGQWQQWMLFRNRTAFSATDPMFDREIGFFVFQLPFLEFLVQWAFTAVLVVGLLTATAHFLNGGIQVVGSRVSASPQVKAHLSVLAAVLALLKAGDYALDRYGLVYSSAGVVEGAGYTDVTARLPALHLLIAISLFAAVLMVLNISRRGWMLPSIALGLWALVAVVVGVGIPTAVQELQVEPNESDREAPYIARNIAATRDAYDLAQTRIHALAASDDVSMDELEASAATVANIRLWDPDVLIRSYEREQEIRNFFRFNDTDVDRYDDGSGSPIQVLISVRELEVQGVPSPSWVNLHLAYTHGYGAVMSPSNGATSDGNPVIRVGDLPVSGSPTLDRPAVYYGENLPGYAIVDTRQGEVDYTTAQGSNRLSRYEGSGGVRTSSWLRRAALAVRFGDTSPLLSRFVTSQSRAIYVRDIGQRVRKAAPFLHYDSDPYPVIHEGRILWIYDAYTTTSRYPYSQTADVSRLGSSSGLVHRFNYVRNSVKVVIDAYDGSMTFYVVDRNDPLARAYQRAFPGLFTSGDELHPELRAHLRYPQDLFKVQTNMYGRYHMEDPTEFYNGTDSWEVAQEPGSVGAAAPATVIAPDGTLTLAREGRMDPQYSLMQLPGEEGAEFVIVQPFVPLSGDDVLKNMTAFMVARSDPGSYGEIDVYESPRDRQVDGPGLVNARINQDATVSREITLLDQRGSNVTLGHMLLVPVGDSLLWVRPLYVEAAGTTPLPQLTYVIVVHGDRVVMRPTLRESLTELFGASPPTLEQRTEDDRPPLAGEGDEELAEALAEAEARFQAADEALRAGDLAAYQREVAAAREAIRRAQALALSDPRPPSMAT